MSKSCKDCWFSLRRVSHSTSWLDCLRHAPVLPREFDGQSHSPIHGFFPAATVTCGDFELREKVLEPSLGWVVFSSLQAGQRYHYDDMYLIKMDTSGPGDMNCVNLVTGKRGYTAPDTRVRVGKGCPMPSHNPDCNCNGEGGDR